jgi:uncharacterized protein
MANAAMTLHLQKITPAEHRVMPWKNGLGTTREIAIDPPGAAMTDAGFRWRLSIADVGQSGPFSAFPGIDRTIMVIKGRGMVLTVDGQAPRRLDECFVPFAFSGDAATDCQLIDGPVQDFNLMVNRSLLSAQLEVRSLYGTISLRTSEEVYIVHLLAGAADIHINGLRKHGNTGDTIISSELPSVSVPLELAPRGEATVAITKLATIRRR